MSKTFKIPWGHWVVNKECIQNPNPLFRLEILVNKRDPTFKMKWNLYYYFKNYFYKQTNNMQWIFIFHTSIKKKPCGVNFVSRTLLNWLYILIYSIWCLFFMLISRFIKKKPLLNHRSNSISGCKRHGSSDDVKKNRSRMGNHDRTRISERDVHSDVIRRQWKVSARGGSSLKSLCH